MQHISLGFKKLLIGYLVCFWTLSPLLAYAAPLAPDGTTPTTLDKARNGVPVVNIASPNATGLSHNRFTHYNVNTNGLILNNARTTAVNTQLGGYITGNPHLTNNARLILNEVTSTNRTQLNGFTEVAGPRTDLVLANPNGLTINGGGFINTGRLTLTTGKPVITGGALQSLRVTGGDIAIQGAGLNTQGATSTELYTQYLNLNAKVHAQNLDVKLGGNNVNYPTGTATANGAANARTVLLDTSTLGGMYANMITLVGTDKGLGVNLPPEVLASAGDITINNDGTIALQTMSASGAVDVSSTASNISATKSIYAGTSATLKAGKAVNVNAGGAVAAGSTVNVSATTLNNSGVVTAGLASSGTQKLGGTVNVTAGNVGNTGDMLASGGMNVTSTGALTNSGTASSGGAMTINAVSLSNTGTISGGSGASNITANGNVDNASRISAAGDLSVKGSNITNNGFFNAGNNLTMTSTNLTNNQTLFAGNNMNLYTTGTLTNNPNANIYAMNNLTMAANAGLGKTASIVNDRANIETYRGNMDVYAASLTNRTNMPVVQGTYVATVPGIPAKPRVPRHFVRATWVRTPTGQFKRIRPHWVPAQPARPAVPPVPEHIVGGTRLSTVSRTTNCGFNCKNVVTTTVDAMRLASSSAPATINAGGNLNVNVNSITNQYSLMSASGNIHLAAQVVDNQPVNILSVTTVSTAMYRNSRQCGGFNFFSVCIGGWNNVQVLAGTSVGTSKKVSNTVASTIQAGGSITGNVANLTNGNIKQNQTIAASAAQTQNTSTTPVNAAVPAITLPVGSTGLFVVSPNPQGQYLIETNPTFAVYGNFISSNYLLQHIGYSPLHAMKRLGDAFYENRLIRDSIFAQTGRRFLNSRLRSDYAQYQYLMDNALAQQEDLQLIPGVSLTLAQIAALKSDIVWIEEQEVAGRHVLVPVVYIANTHEYLVEGGKIIAGDDIDLLVDRLNNSGLMEAGNNLNIDASDKVTNHDGTMRAGNDLNLTAKNDIENISADMRAKNITLVASDGNIINRRYVETQDYSGAGVRDVKTVTGKAGNIEASGNLALNAGDTITVTGSRLAGEEVSLKAGRVDIGATEVRSDFAGGAAGVSYETGYVKHLGSTVEGEKIAMLSPGSVTISGSDVKAEKDLSIATRQLNVLSVHDSSYDKLTNESKGLLSSYKQVDETRTSRAIASHLKAKRVNVSTATMTMIGSSIEADSARITAQVLNLVSDKNRTFERHFKDTSGLILRTIADKGHINETAAPSTIKAEKLIFNGRTLGGSGQVEGGHDEGDHHGDDRDGLITALSSEHNLNEAQINQIKAVLNSSEWDKETTTLSQTGSLIVQAVVAYVTAGAGSGAAAAVTSGIENVAMQAAAQAAVAATIDSIAAQISSQLVTAALTGEGLHLDVGAIARNAVMSGLVAGVNFKMDAMIKSAKLGEAGSAVARGVGHAVTTEAVYGGKFEDVLKASLISEASAESFKFIGHELKTPGNRKLNLPETTVLHAMVGGALAQLSGGDFTTGAIATATSHVVAEQVRSHYLDQVVRGDMSIPEMESKVLAITNLVGGAAALAVHPNMSPKELAAAQSMSASVVQNNSLKLIVTAAKIGKRLYTESRKLKRAGGKLGKSDIKRVLKEDGLDIVGDLYTFIDPNASIADMAWAAADLTLGTSFNNRAFAVAKKFGKGKKARTAEDIRGAPKPGDRVYRVWGDGANANGRSWSRTDPRSVDNYRDASGLPDQNSGRFVTEGRLTDTKGVTQREALPLHGNKGGLDELVVPDPTKQIRIDRVSGVNPEF